MSVTMCIKDAELVVVGNSVCGCVSRKGIYCFDYMCPGNQNDLDNWATNQWVCINKWQGEDNGRACPVCEECGGTGRYNEIGYEYYVQMANGIFEWFADMLGIHANEYLTGEIKGKELDMLYKAVTKLYNNKSLIKNALCYPTTRNGNFIECGRDEYYWDRKLQELLTLIKETRKINSSIVYG